MLEASPEEGLLPFRSDPGLGRASWAAMMRPSCCKDSRPARLPAGLIVVNHLVLSERTDSRASATPRSAARRAGRRGRRVGDNLQVSGGGISAGKRCAIRPSTASGTRYRV